MANPADIEGRIQAFRGDLVKLPPSILVQKHITYGDCYALDSSLYFELKSSISDHFQIHPSQVQIVGSAKLGFSIVEDRRYRPFGDTSDVDVAIISSELFDSIWTEVFHYWRSKAYWPDVGSFRGYLFRGWIRPDKLPPENTFARRKDWWEFFRGLSSSNKYGAFPIKAGLYKSWDFLESYQFQCVSECKEMETNK